MDRFLSLSLMALALGLWLPSVSADFFGATPYNWWDHWQNFFMLGTMVGMLPFFLSVNALGRTGLRVALLDSLGGWGIMFAVPDFTLSRRTPEYQEWAFATVSVCLMLFALCFYVDRLRRPPDG